MENICPVCKYNELFEPPYDARGYGSDEICPCCGFQFGLDDYPEKELAFSQWREDWRARGCPWFSKTRVKPENYDPVAVFGAGGSLDMYE